MCLPSPDLQPTPFPYLPFNWNKESRPSASQEVVEVLAAAPLPVIDSASSAVTNSESEDNPLSLRPNPDTPVGWPADGKFSLEWTLRYLLSVDAIRAEAVGVNGMSLTMLDILEYSSVAREDFSRSVEIQQILMDAGLIRRESNENDNPNSAVAAVVVPPNPRRLKKKKKLRKQVAPSEKGSKPARWFWTKVKNWSGYPDDWVKDKHGMLMVVATMISTMTFQALINPPGGVWDHNDTNTTFGNITVCTETSVCKAGTAVLNYGNDPRNYFPTFITYNTLSFLNSLFVTLLLVTGFPPYNWLYMRFLTFFIGFTLTSLALTYLMLLFTIAPDHRIWVSFIVYGLFYTPSIALLVIGGVPRFLNWLMKWSRPMYFKSTSSLKNIIITGSFSHNDPTRFEENEAPAVA